VNQDISIHTSLGPIDRSTPSTRRRGAALGADYRAEAERLAPYEQIARLVIQHRIRDGLSQTELAARINTSVSAISRLESGQHRPNVETLERLARAFGGRLVLGFEDVMGQQELVAVGEKQIAMNTGEEPESREGEREWTHS
jgi:transcriptional regulator with XRE-family HTH domain